MFWLHYSYEWISGLIKRKKKNTYLSQVGKEVLLKSIVQTILTYAISLFLLLKKLCKDMVGLSYVKILVDFWLSWQQNSVAKMKKLGIPKNRGGMGFRDLVSFNKVMLAKQIWRIFQNPSSLIFQILNCKYFTHGNILHTVQGPTPSFIWRSLSTSLPLINAELF